MRILHDVYEYNFGLLLPSKSGVVWEHQTDWVMCHHIFIEGIFLPLPLPMPMPMPHGAPLPSSGIPASAFEPNDLLLRLTQANYKGASGDKTEIRRIRREINKRLFFSYKRTEAPKGQPENQEGIQWIKITRIKAIRGDKLTKNTVKKTEGIIAT